MSTPEQFLGRGLAFPVSVNKATGRIKMSEYEDDIYEAIKIIISTRRGERIMRPEFGSNLWDYVFERPDLGIRAQIKKEVETSLSQWEPRITDLEVDVDFSEEGATGFVVKIKYTVRSTNNPFNLVYPFFITEGNV